MRTVLSKATLLAAVSFSSLMLATQTASAAGPQPYVSVFGGASFLNDINVVDTNNNTETFQFNSGYIFGGAFGMKWNDHLRTELELSHARWAASRWKTSDGGNTADGDLNATYLLGNVWYDFPTHSMFTPYVGGGVGVGWATANVNGAYGLFGSSTGVALQVGLGATVNLTNNIDLDVGYRLKDITNLNFTESDGTTPWSPTNLVSHNVQAGLTIKF